METNYTLKKLIREGTTLLFLLAFMLTGAFSAVANDRADTSLTLKIDGPGEVTVFYSPTDSEKFQNYGTGVLTVELPGTLQTGQVIEFFPADLVECYTFYEWEWDENVQNYQLLPGDGLQITLPLETSETLVTAIFGHDYLDDPEFIIPLPPGVCADTNVQIEFANPDDLEFPLHAYVTRNGVTATLGTINEGDLLVDEPLDPGEYYYELVELFDANQCIIDGPIEIGTITVNPLPTPDILVNTSFCADELIEPTVDGDHFGEDPSYHWTVYEDDTIIDTSIEEEPEFGPLSAGEYLLKVVVTNNETGCVGDFEIEITVNPLPIIFEIIAEEVCYEVEGEEFTVEIIHSDDVNEFDWVLNRTTSIGEFIEEVSTGKKNPDNVTETEITFLSNLLIGYYTLEVSGVNNIHGCSSIEESFQVDFRIRPPVYATFSPFYRKDADGNIINIAEGSSITNPTGQEGDVDPEIITYVPIHVAENDGLFIQFSDPVTSGAPAYLPLPGVDQGEFILLHKLVEGVEGEPDEWVRVDVKVNHVGDQKYAVRPVEFGTNNPVALEWETMYRLSHQDVYKTTCGAQELVNYRLSKIAIYDDGEFIGYEYDEYQVNAYSKNNTAVYFSTMPVEFANLPIVYPIDDDARCKQIEVEFMNPVSYLSGQEITPDGDPMFKFDLQKRAFGEDEWVSDLIIDYVEIPVESMVDVVPVPESGPTAGPTHMIIHLTQEMDYGVDYRIAMTASTNGYGFMDLVLGIPVLDVEIEFSTQNTGLNGGWSWSTSQYYPIVFDLEPWETDWYGEQTEAAGTMNNVVFSNDLENLVQYIYDADTDTWSLLKKSDAYDVDFYGGDFTVTAEPGEGYRFIRWKRSTDGGATFEDLPTSHSIPTWPAWQTEGYHFFPQSFTWRPDTFQVQTSAGSPFMDVWMHPSCGDNDFIYKAQFEKKRYTVRSWPAKDNAPNTINHDVGIVTTIGGDHNRVHGTTVTVEATPKPGYYFTGWNLTHLPEGIDVREVYIPPNVVDILNPLDHTAVLELDMLGDHAHGATFTVYAKFEVFEPKIYAAAQGIKYHGDIKNNITPIVFENFYGYNQLEAGLDMPDVLIWDENNYYIWKVFRYGNPLLDESGVFTDFTKIMLTPVDKRDEFCEYNWDEVLWERWHPDADHVDGGVWEDFSTDLSIEFIPAENYILRATFEWREDDVDLDVVVYEDAAGYEYPGYGPVPYGDATIMVEYIYGKDGRIGDRWINGNASAHNQYYHDPLTVTNFSPGDKLRLTVFPEPNYTTFYWKENGEEIIASECSSNYRIELIERNYGSGSPDNSVWEYTIGCPEEVLLQPVLKIKRYPVEIKAVNFDTGAQLTTWGVNAGGHLSAAAPTYHIEQKKFDCDIANQTLTDTRYGLGLNVTSSNIGQTIITKYNGRFEKAVGDETYSDFTVTAVPRGVTGSTYEWIFVDWQELVGGVWQTITNDEQLIVEDIDRMMQIRARFQNIYEEPVYELTVTDDIDDYVAVYIPNATRPTVQGHPYYFAHGGTGGNNIVTLNKGFVAGYNFVTWELLEGILLEAPIEGDPLFPNSPTLGGDYFRFPDLLDFELAILDDDEDATDEEIVALFLQEVELRFRMPANDVEINASYELHQYEVKVIVRTHYGDHNLDCLLIDDELGGTATPDNATAYYNDVVNFTAVANVGFTMVNWMFGEINDCEGEGGLCANNNAITGWQINPFNTSPGAPGANVDIDFRIPRLDQREYEVIYLYAIFANTPHNYPYPIYTLSAQTDSYDSTVGPWLIEGKDGVAAVQKFGDDYNDDGDVWFEWSTDDAATYAHGNMAKVWVNEEDIKPGYEFVRWADHTVSSQDGMEAHVCMNDNQAPTALFRAISYDLLIMSNEAFGGVQLADQIIAISNQKPYTIEDSKIRVYAAVDQGANQENEYRLMGFYYDSHHTIPVVDADGEVVLDIQDFADGVIDHEFFFTPVIPETIANTSFTNEVRIYARFAKQAVDYTVTLRSKFENTGEYDLPIYDELDVNDQGTSAIFNYGDMAYITTAPAEGYVFKHWKYFEDGSWIVTEPTTSFPVFGSVDLVAVFRAIEYDLFLNPIVEDVDDPEPLDWFVVTDSTYDNYIIGEEVTVTAIYPDNYYFDGFTYDDDLIEVVNEDGDELTFIWGVDNVTITGEFKLKRYEVGFTVLAADGQPLEDAVIFLNGLSGITDADGEYVFTGLLPDEYEFTVSYPGLSDIEGIVIVENVDVSLTVSFEECPAPTDLTVYVTAKTAFITWDAGVTDAWQVRVDGDAWEYVDVSEFLIEDIYPSADYEFEVRAVCEDGVVSAVKGITFTTVALGDVDGNGVIEPTDRTLIIAFMNNMIPADFVIHTADQLVDYDEVGVFIFDAADIDGNGTINILDLVRWVNIFNAVGNDKSLQSDAAGIFMDKSVAHLESDGSLAALQFEIIGKSLDMIELSMLVTGYELFWNVDGDLLTGFIVSHDNRAFSKGMTELFEIRHTEAFEWGKVFAANINGEKVEVDTYDIPTNITDNFASELSVIVYPNPSGGQFTSVVDAPASSKVTLKLYDLSGREHASKQLIISGVEHVGWNEDLNPGIYILRMIAAPEGLTDQSVTREVRVLIK